MPWAIPSIAVMVSVLARLLPLLPAVLQLVPALAFRRTMADPLPDGEATYDVHRDTTLAVVGMVLALALALVASDTPGAPTYGLITSYVAVSVLGYLTAAIMQGRKERRWHVQLRDAALEVGTLSLLLVTLATVLTWRSLAPYHPGVIVAAVGLWLMMHEAAQLTLAWRSLRRTA